jgi:putative MATE family efflux protein
MLEVSTDEITEGDLVRAMLVLAAPLLVQNFVRVFQQIADLFWIGRYSSEAVSGVGLAVPLTTLLLMAAAVPAYVGTQVLVSQRVGGGSGDPRRALATGLGVTVGTGLLFGTAGYLAAGPLVDLVTSVQPTAEGSGAVRKAAVGYLQVYSLGLVFLGLPDAVEAAFVGWGDSRASLYINALTVLVNVVVDPFFVFGVGGLPELGAAGAALGSVVGAAAGLGLAAALVARDRVEGMFDWSALHLDVDEYYELLDVGLPSAAQQAGRQVVRVGLYVVVFVAGGAAGLAAFLVGARVASAAFIPAIGLQQAAQSVVGQNLGAAKPERAQRAVYAGATIAAVGLGLIGVVQWVVPDLVTSVLAPELDASAAALSVDYLRILAYGYPALGALYLFEGGFNGARRTRTSFVATMLQHGAVRLPIAVVGGVVLAIGIHAVFWSVTISNVVAALGVGAYYRYSIDSGMLDRAVEVANAAPEG